MTREIKFRVWDELEKKLEFGMPILMLAGWLMGKYKLGEYLGRYKYLQFTGLKDKLGKEIYEGDILLCGDDGEYFGQKYDEVKDEYLDIDKFVVEWGGESETYAAFDLKDNPCEEFNGLSHAVNDGYVQVLGNIYENPELLNK